MGEPPASNRLTNIVPVKPRFGSLFIPAMVAMRASAQTHKMRKRDSCGDQ